MSGDIVVIEDDADTRETLKDVLCLEGFSVSTAENGAAGLELIERIGPPCLILLDLMMPVMSGWEFLERVREHEAPSVGDAPIVVLSAAADLVDVGRRFGCDVVRKPADIGQLVDIARRFCNGDCADGTCRTH
jgi:CheY-like chemotaxis protein